MRKTTLSISHLVQVLHTTYEIFICNFLWKKDQGDDHNSVNVLLVDYLSAADWSCLACEDWEISAHDGELV